MPLFFGKGVATTVLIEESGVPPERGSHVGIDREGPRIRPDRRALMRQDWHHLLFLHWPVPPESLRAQLPPGLEIDLFEGTAYVGLTPFTLTNVRPVGVPPLPFVSRFHETNVRTYVHSGGRDPGVWFFSLDASNPLAVVAARTLLGLPYKTARIRLSMEGDAPVIDYRLQRRRPGPTPASCAVRYQPRGPVVPAAPGSLEFFLIERYVLYNTVRGRLYRQRARGVEAEEPHAGVAAPGVDVGPHVRLVEPGDERERGHSDGANVGQGERREPDVGPPLEEVELQAGREQQPELLGRDRPVEEQQVMPVLTHHRGAIGSDPRPFAIDALVGTSLWWRHDRRRPPREPRPRPPQPANVPSWEA
jgi:uncharacterized protein YqjF (DUF2071 family)